MTFKLSFNDYYSQDISNKIKTVKQRKQEKGEYQAPYAPFGYKKDPNNKNHLIINEETSPIVKRIFELYLQGTGTPQIARILNEENVPTPSKFLDTKRYIKCSHRWNKGSVHRILREKVYVGTVTGHKSYKVNHKVNTRIKLPRKDWKEVENTHEPIIDKKTFETVQQKLSNGKVCRTRKYDNPLKPFVYCGHCGRKATLKTYKKQLKTGEVREYQYFICCGKSFDSHLCDNGRISSSIITPIVEQTIKEECSKIVFSEGDITNIYEQVKKEKNNSKVSLEKKKRKLEEEIQQIEKKVDQIYSDKLDGIIKSEDFFRFYNMYQEQKEKILTEVNKLKYQMENITNQKMISYKEIKKISKKCLDMEKLNPDLLNKLIDKIEYSKGRKIKIKFKFMENQ